MFDSKMKIMIERMRLEFYGYPADYWEKFPTEIGKVTLDDVKRVSQKYLNPNGFALLVVGKSAEFDSPLDSLGAVSNLDITIPPPPPGALGGKPTAGPTPTQAPGTGAPAQKPSTSPQPPR
jgi:zinc protease